MTTFSLANDYLFPKVEGNFRNFFIADFCELKNFKISKKNLFSHVPSDTIAGVPFDQRGRGGQSSEALAEGNFSSEK